MPRDGAPLTPREIEGLVEWVKMGAPWPESAPKIVLAASVSGEAEGGMTPGARIFVNKVRPVLEQKCFACHTSEERGGLRLDSRERMLQGGKRGPAIIPGNPEQSLIIAALRHERDDLDQRPDHRPGAAQQGGADGVNGVKHGRDQALVTVMAASALA